MRKSLFYYVIVFFFLFSCDKEIERVLTTDSNNEIVTVLYERDQNYPLKLVSDSYLQRTRGVQPENPSLSYMNYLGNGYSIQSIPIADAIFAKQPIINIGKLIKSPDSSFVSKRRYYNTEATYFTFSNSSRYTTNSVVSNKISQGWDVGFKLFNLGANNSIQNVYKNYFLTTDSVAYGELNVNIYKHIYKLNAETQYDKQKLAFSYLYPIFIEDLYNSSAAELLNKYGEFMLKGFYTGGRATAFFGAKFQNIYNQTTRETVLKDSIRAGYKTESINGSLNISLGYSNSNTSSTNHITSGIFASTKTIGGNSGYPASFSIPIKFSNININLSTWGNSLDTDESTHAMIELTDGGVLPLSDIIIETDIKNGITTTLTMHESLSPKIRIPYFEIYQQTTRAGTIFRVSLYTRLGYTVLVTIPSELTTADAIAGYLRSHFKALKIIHVTQGRTNSSFSQIVSLQTRDNNSSRGDRYSFVYALDKTKMKKFINSESGLTYLLYDNGTSKYAFSIYDNFIIDTYGIRDLLNSVPTVNLTMQQLYQYQILTL